MRELSLSRVSGLSFAVYTSMMMLSAGPLVVVYLGPLKGIIGPECN